MASRADTIARGLSAQVWASRAERWLRRAELAVQTIRDAPGALAPTGLRPQPAGLAILDDAFPSMRSGFRVCEYNGYLRHLPETRIFTTGRALSALGERRPIAWVRREYERKHPEHAGKTFLLSGVRQLNAKGAYMLFIYNAFRMIERVERERIPFMFTLYPGGGFAIDGFESDKMLRRVFDSPMFRGVITTQVITNDYLEQKALCSHELVHFIYGGVFPVNDLVANLAPRQRFPEQKRTFDVCFVAHRYMPGGADKGYDIFVEAAKILHARHPDVFFHVVGPWSPADADVEAIADRITFYGTRPSDFFGPFYSRMDAILSPNRPFVLRPGAFDGFPTGACMEAGLCGVPVICGDPLRLNVSFKNEEEIVLAPPDAEAYAAEVSRLRNEPERWTTLSAATATAFRRAFQEHAQIEPRIALLKAQLGIT